MDEENQMQRNEDLNQPIEEEERIGRKIKIRSSPIPLHKKVHFHSFWLSGIVTLISIPFLGVQGIGVGIFATSNLFSIIKMIVK